MRCLKVHDRFGKIVLNPSQNYFHFLPMNFKTISTIGGQLTDYLRFKSTVGSFWINSSLKPFWKLMMQAVL